MSFLSIKINPTNLISAKHKTGKEQDSFLAHHEIKFSHSLVERASAFTSRGSLTVEAAFSVCFFFLAMLCVSYLLEIMALQLTVRNALYSAGKEVAAEAFLNPIVSAQNLEEKMKHIIGEEQLNQSSIVGGSKGLDCSKSRQLGDTTIMELSVCYKVEIPILMFRIPILTKEETLRVKGWTGREKVGAGNPRDEVVYVTDYGIVYHKNLSCTYLELSLKAVKKERIAELRNENGGKYSACTRCGGKGNIVYVTDHGERYHATLECGGLNRNIYAVKLADLYGIGGCSKCVK